MNILEQIKDLQTDIQVVGCGENVIPFIHKILKNDPTHYECLGKIMGKQKTLSTIFIDCSYTTPRIYNPDYFQEWVKHFMESDKIYIVLNIALCNIYKKYGHSNALIINKILKTVERFEPRGKPSLEYYDDSSIEKKIKEFCETNFIGFTYISPYEYIGDKGPQCKTTLNLDMDFGRGLCVNYTILYLYLRCKENLNRDESILFINTHFLDINLLKFTNFVNSYLL